MAKKHWVERLIVENFCRFSEIFNGVWDCEIVQFIIQCDLRTLLI